MPTSKFDSSSLDQEQKQILQDLTYRRKIFDTYLFEKKIPLATCPGCGYPTLHERGAYEICDICNWEDDYQDDKEADEIWGGPNSDLSLTENRINIGIELQATARELTEER